MHLTRDAARADVAELVRLLAESHPDPYAGSGGPVAFHRQARDIFAAIPEDGTSDVGLLRLLRPLVASVRDGHTRIGLDAPATPGSRRLWLEWEVVEQELYISAVYRPEDTPLIGGRLRGLCGVAFDALRERMDRLRGYDNKYQDLLHLAAALADPLDLSELLERDAPPETLAVDLLLPDGYLHTVDLPLSAEAPGSRIVPPTTLALPKMTAAQIGWSFLDDKRQVAYLRANSMMHYREAFEYSLAIGSPALLDLHLEATARAAYSDDLPPGVEARIALVPSATEMLRDLCAAMRGACSRNLLVDLRFCPGGNSLFAFILSYYLYGVEVALAVDEGYQVKRYSPLYLANRQATSREELEPFLQNGGYDFTAEEAWQRRRREGVTPAERDRRYHEYAGYAAQMPTFGRVFERRQDEAMWAPRVVVLTAARTYSAGFDVAAHLVQLGARVVGVPAAQAGNCFIDVLPYTLTHSGLQGIISHKWSRWFPDDPERGRVLRPERELTYAYLASHRFDPHASVALALEYLRG